MGIKATTQRNIFNFLQEVEGPFTYASFDFQAFSTDPQKLSGEKLRAFLEQCREKKFLPFASASVVFTGSSLGYQEKLTSLIPRDMPDEAYNSNIALQQRVVQGFRPYQFSLRFPKQSFPGAFDTFKRHYGLAGNLLGEGYKIRDGRILFDPNNTGSTDLDKVVEINFNGIPEPQIEITAPEALREYETKLLARIK